MSDGQLIVMERGCCGDISVRECQGNLWDQVGWKVVMTNGSIRRDGCAVMGRGVVRQAVERYPPLPALLGTLLCNYGNRVYPYPAFQLFTFPVKHAWRELADIALIRR